jgi:hypothetical protein
VADLTTRSIASSYKELLKTAAANGVTATLTVVEDGDATASSLQLATTSARFTGTLAIDGITTLNNVTDSTTKDDGALVIEGGVGIEKTLNVGGNLNVTGNAVIQGTLTANGGTLTLGDADTDNVVFNADVNSHILPNTDNTYDLGSAAKSWRNLFVDSTATVNNLSITGSQTITATTQSTDKNTGALVVGGGVGIEKNTNIGGNLAVTGTTALTGNTTITGDLAVNGGDLTTSSDAFNLLNTTATTVNFAGAGTSISIGAPTGVTTVNHGLTVAGGSGQSFLVTDGTTNRFTVDSTNGNTVVSGTLEVTGGSTMSGNLAVNGGALTTNQTTFNLLNTTATTVNFAGAATTLNLGTSSGTLTIGNATITGTNATSLNLNGADPSIVTSSTGTVSVFNSNAATGNLFGAATAISIGAVTGTTTIRNNTQVNGTLGVTGATNLSSTLGVTGATTLSSTLGVTGAALLSSTLGVSDTISATKASGTGLAVTADATVGGDLTVTGNLTINGTTTNINTTNLVVEDKNVILGDVATPTDVTADGGGITLKGATDKTLNWVDTTDAWTSSEHFNLATTKEYRIAGNSVLSATTLGSGVTGSSLTSVGTIGAGVWQGTIVDPTYGGTGVNNASRTITLGGNLTTSGAFATTLTSTAATNITLPTTGTLATLANAETLTNKTISLTDNTLQATSAQIAAAVTDETGTGSLVFATSPVLVTPTLGAASATSLTLTNDLAVSEGGTGTSTLTANGVLLGNNTSAVTATAAGTNGQVLAGVTSAAPAFVTVSGDATISNTGALAISNNAVTDADLRDSAALSVMGNATNASADPADISASSDHVVLRRSGTTLGFGAVNLASTNAVTGTLPIGNGGTGVTATPTNGQLLIGNGTGFTLATLTAGSNVTIQNTEGSILIASGGGGGGGGGGAADLREIWLFT